MLCEICGIPLGFPGICGGCSSDKPSFRALRAWTVFDDPVRNALHKLKYRRDISLGEALSAQMSSFLGDLNWPVDVIVPIPLSWKRLKERGYNQVAMIALPLALSLKIDYESRGLIRQKETRSQVGLTRVERKENVRGAFSASSHVYGRTVLLVDDVSTTGSTLSSASDALLESGARSVYALTVARALPHQMQQA